MGALVDAGVVKLAKDDDWLTVELSSGLCSTAAVPSSAAMPAPCSIRFPGILKPVDNYVRGAGLRITSR